MRVPFHSAYPFLRMRGIAADNWSPGNAMVSSGTYDNGLLLVSVLTPLVSPVSPQNLAIMVSVRGAPNLEYANLRNTLAENEGYAPPSFFAVQGKDEVDISSSEEALGDTGSQHPNRYALNFGEQIVSLRTVAHRMSLYDYIAAGQNTATRYLRFVKSYSRLPPMYGYDPNGLSTATKVLAGVGSAPFNFTPTHPMTYIAMMYGGFRGGVNYTANVAIDLYPYIGDIVVQRMTTTTDASSRRGRYIATLNTGATSNVTAAFLNETYPGTAGAGLTNSQAGGPITWNAPQLGPTNFNFCDPTYAITGNSTDQTNVECTSLAVLVHQITSNTVTDHLIVNSYAGSGVDWHCIWLLACPTLDYYVSKPAGV